MTKAATILALLATATTLQGCDFLDILQGQPTKAERNHVTIATQAEMHAHTQALLGGLYGPEPEPEAPAIVAEAPPAVAAPEPAPPPAPVYEYDLYNADPAGYVCTAVFRSLSCLDDGRPVYLDAQMGQLPFGERP